MAFAEVSYTATAAQTVYTIPFPFLRSNHITCTVDGSPATITVGTPSATELTISSPSIVGGEIVRIERTTPITDAAALVDWTNPSTLRREDLQTMYEELRYALQENADDSTSGLQLDTADMKWDADGKIIKSVLDPTAAQDAATKAYVDAQVISSGVVPPFSASEALYFLRVNGTGSSVLWVQPAYETYLFTAKSVTNTYTFQRNYPIIPAFSSGYGDSSQRIPWELVDTFNGGTPNVSISGDYDITVGAGQWLIECDFHAQGFIPGAVSTNQTYAQLAITNNLNGGSNAIKADGGGDDLETPELYGTYSNGSGGSIIQSSNGNLKWLANLGAATTINIRGRGTTSSNVMLLARPSFVRITRWTR